MLGGHPTLFAPPELVLLNYNTMGERYRILSSERDKFWLQGAVRALMEAGRLDEGQAARTIADYERNDRPVKDFYSLIQSLIGGGLLLVEKTPHYALDLATLLRIEEDFEDPLYIHLVRHPAPVIASFEEARLQAFFPPFFTAEPGFGSCRLAETVWDVCHQNILNFLAKVPAERQLRVRFEALVRDPIGSMQTVADFLGVDYHPNMADPYRKKHDGARMSDAHHPLGRMLGDVKFEKHGRVRAEAADRRGQRFPETQLGDVTRELAGRLGYSVVTQQPRHLATLQPAGEAPPLYGVHPAGGSVACYRDLSRELGPNQPFFAFGSPVGHKIPGHRSLQGMARTYIQELRRHQPEGPYRLAGWSFGGLVAFEMALQLRAAGQSVTHLIAISSYLIDTTSPMPVLRLRDFALDFLNEHGLNWKALNLDGLNRRRLLLTMLRVAKRSGLVADDLDFEAFRRVMIGHRLNFRSHVHIGRRYVPEGRVPKMLLFDAEDRSLDGKGPFAPWDPFVSELEQCAVSGNHFTMLRNPSLGVMVERIRHYLFATESVE